MPTPQQIKQKSKEHANFFENFDEMVIRLRHTIVMYDGIPMNVIALATHKDGIIRLYMEEVGHDKGPMSSRFSGWGQVSDYPDPLARGTAIDKFIELNPTCGIVRKMANSPKFNKFRPFALGMMNYHDKVVYVERVPQRHTQQGLTAAHLIANNITLGERDSQQVGKSPSSSSSNGSNFKMAQGELFRASFRDCILAQHPPAKMCLKNLQDPTIANEGAAFHREFAFLRGPVETLYLAYKTDIIGHLPKGELSELRIPRKFAHTKEAVEELSLFKTVQIS